MKKTKGVPVGDLARMEKSERKKLIVRAKGQQRLVEAIEGNSIIVAEGPAGTGKTLISIAKAYEALTNGDVDRIVLTRPAVSAGEDLGFLPGGMEDKLAPYLMPLYDALHQFADAKHIRGLMAEGLLEIAPLAYMRGRTFTRCFVVVDEAQNCTYAQLKMLLTRLGFNATMVVNGDPEQSDLPNGKSGFKPMLDKLRAMQAETEGLAVVSLHAEDIVRHPLVAALLKHI